MSYEFEAELVNDCVGLLKTGWFKRVKMEVAGQRKAKGCGSSVGLPDAFLAVNGWYHPLEFKRPKTDETRAGRFSLDQIVAAEARLAAGIYTYAPRTRDEFIKLLQWSQRHQPISCSRCPNCPVVFE